MAQKKVKFGVEPTADSCSPIPTTIDIENVVFSPELVKLRYDLLVRRGQAWGVGQWLPPYSK